MTVVAVLARAPLLGLVKTRLAADIGAERALAVYRSMGKRVVDRVASAHRVCVWYDPPACEGVMREWLGNGPELRPQPEGDLGKRLSSAFQSHFDAGDGPVIVIGTDAPEVDAATVAAARAALDRADVVLGPAMDGGYYLMGLRQPHPELFHQVPWSTPDVLRITSALCKTLHLEVSLLGPLRDVDTSADLVALGLEPHP